ncbi:MAG: translocation/assembly module TamB [Spirochaetaceae bacterium]|jgi:hypothetical protein|nr:translocation/assembly module TamB [Spirochaetaceae bacterium]
MGRKSGFDISIILFVALVLLTAALLKPLRQHILTRIESMRDAFIEKLETLSGKKVYYASMGPSIFGTIDINGISLYAQNEDDMFPYVSVKRMRLRYSLAALLSGKPLETPDFLPLTLSLEDPFVEIKTDKDFDELFSGGSGEFTLLESIKNITGIAPQNMVLRISGGEVRFTAGQSMINALGVDLSAQIINKTLRFHLFAGAETRFAAQKPFDVSLSTRIDGIYDTRNGKSGIKISLESVKSSFFTVNRLNLLASLNDNTINLQKVGDREPYDLSISYNITESLLEGRASFDGFTPSRILRFSPELREWNSWLGTRFYGKAAASFNKAEGLAYSAALSGDFGKNSPAGNGSFNLDARGGAESVYFNVLEVSTPRGDLSWVGSFNFTPFMPAGNLTFNDFNFTKSGDKDKSNSLNGGFFVSSYGNTINLFADTLFVRAPASQSSGGVELQAFDISISRTGSDFDFTASAFSIKNTETYDEASFSPVSVDGSFDFDNKNMEIRLEPESFSLRDLIKIAGCAVELPYFPAQAYNFLDNILITSEIFVSTDFKDMLYNVPHLIVVWQGNSNIWASLSISGTEGGFELSESHLVWNGGGVDISARGDFEDVNDMVFDSELRTKNSSYTLQAAILDKNSIQVSSSFGLNLNVNRSPAGAFTGILFIESPRFPMGDGFAELSAEAEFRYDSPASWMFNIGRFKISGAKSMFSSGGDIEFAGRVDQDGAEFSRIYFDDGRGALYGSAFGSWEGFFRHEEAVITGNIDLRDASNSETLNAQLRWAEDSLFLWLELKDLQSGRFVSGAGNMFITGGIGFFKTPENWSAAFDLSSLRGLFYDIPVTLSGRGSVDDTSFVLGETRLSYGGLFADIDFLNIDLGESKLNSRARLRGETLDREFNADIVISASFAEITSWFNAGSALRSFDGVMEFKNTRFATFESVENFDLKFSRLGNIWNIEGGPEDMIRLHMNGEGDFFAAFSYPSPALGTISGFIKDGMIDAEVSNFYVDLSSLWRYTPLENISIPGGFVIAALRVHGSLRDPEFFGTAVVNSLRLNVPSLLTEEIGPTPAFLTFSGNEIRLEPVNVWIGRGQGRLSGVMRISRWRPSSFDMALNVEQSEAIPLNMNIAGFLLKGTVFGILNLNSDGQALNILGDIGSDNIEISPAAEEAPAGSGETARPNMPVQTNIRITAGRKVEFLWPNADIPILQAYASAGSSLRVESDSLSGHFSINGDIDIRGGEVFYFQRSFYIKNGSMSFNESEIQFDPRFSVVAETRDRTNNEPVTISMIIENQPLRSFTPRFDSNPPLSQIEIFTLLGDKFAGATTEENAIQRAFVSSTADVLAQFGVVRQFERTVRDFLHIDMFSLRTQALQNAILMNVFRDDDDSAAQSEDQLQTRNATQIGNYFDNTTVFLGKYIGAGLFLQAMLSLRYDPYSTDMGGLIIEPDLSMEFKGPLFDIRWDLVPTHPENIWISDNKITLSKKWTLP